MTKIDFDKGDGLVPAIVQDARSGDVLMLGYMNQEAVDHTIRTGRVTFFSRSKSRLWTKGETSGNYLEHRSLSVDCDGDAILIRAVPSGAVCHTGEATCWGDIPNREGLGFLRTLETVIAGRAHADAAASYTKRLLDGGPSAAGQKVGEEAVETVIAGLSGDDDQLLDEAADLVYHLLVLLRTRGLTLDDVGNRLRSRHDKS